MKPQHRHDPAALMTALIIAIGVFSLGFTCGFERAAHIAPAERGSR